MKSSDSLSPIEAARKILEAKNNEEASELVEGVEEELEATETEIVEEEIDDVEEDEIEIENIDEEEEEEMDEAYGMVKSGYGMVKSAVHGSKKEMMGHDKKKMLKANKDKTIDPKSAEDPDLYQDAEGKHAKIETDKGTEGKDKGNKASVNMKPSAAASTVEKPKAKKEHVEALFNGEDLSEDFKTKATTIFEAAINESLETYGEALEEDYNNRMAEEVEIIKTELAENMNDYLGYVVEEWVKENEVALERGLRAEVAENFMTGLKNLFTEHYIDIPEEKYDVLEGLVIQVEELQEKLDKEIESNIELRNENNESACEKLFMESTHGMVDTDVEKLKSLAEGLEFDSVEQFEEKLNVLKENYFKGDTPSDMTFISEDTTEEDRSSENLTGSMKTYADVISRTIKK
mgnify:CR=1 FL=1|tara:strand:+ start:211 stop:1425 length:1215 start_codon:yes stop_codon:yes gene_type:complete